MRDPKAPRKQFLIVEGMAGAIYNIFLRNGPR
jgi:hypothetical protein